ncbi:MAG TPA: hypothetical protein VJK51_04115 [Candidatus Nanoarchaeia archaeon]|nr:hypothetical protein [Candidatus Nanoarchaeia archaeon]
MNKYLDAETLRKIEEALANPTPEQRKMFDAIHERLRKVYEPLLRRIEDSEGFGEGDDRIYFNAR